jgi:hypothetical protein
MLLVLQDRPQVLVQFPQQLLAELEVPVLPQRAQLVQQDLLALYYDSAGPMAQLEVLPVKVQAELVAQQAQPALGLQLQTAIMLRTKNLLTRLMIRLWHCAIVI